MTNKTELINTIIDCVNDSIDLDSNKVSLGILIALLNDNIPKQLTIGGVSQRSELLIAFLTDNIHGNLYFTKEVAIKAVDEYLSNL